MSNDLIERYIYATTKRLPLRTREDVARELRTLIEDMLKERCGEITPSDKDIRVVLTELGTPNELYEQYAGDGKKWLIGPPYYTTYVFVMKIVLICVAFGMTLAAIISFAMGERESANWIYAVGQWIGMLWQGMMGTFAFVTILFVFFEYKGISIDNYAGLEDLPPVPEKKEQISRGETIFGIGISVVFLIVFLVCPQIFCAVTKDGEMIPILSAQVIRNTWYIIVIFSALGIIREVVKLLDGKYTKRVMVTAVITDLLSALCSFWWLLRKDIINPEFIGKISELFEGDGQFITAIFSNFQYFFLGVILFALLLDMMNAVIKGIAGKE
ncbi:MAG: hypothetical protein ACI4ED_03880 [Suilimivivens sp.]